MYKHHYKEEEEALGHVSQISRVNSLQVTKTEICFCPWLLRLSKQHFLTEQPHSFSPAGVASDSLDNLKPSRFQIFFCFRQIHISYISVKPLPCQALLLFLRGPTKATFLMDFFILTSWLWVDVRLSLKNVSMNRSSYLLASPFEHSLYRSSGRSAKQMSPMKAHYEGALFHWSPNIFVLAHCYDLHSLVL